MISPNALVHLQKKVLQSPHYNEPWGAAILLKHPVGNICLCAVKQQSRRIWLKRCVRVAGVASTSLIFLQTDPMHSSLVTTSRA